MIVLLFELVAVSQYMVFIVIKILVYKVRNPESIVLNTKLRFVLVPFHLAFLAAIICGASSSLGAYCTESRVYPPIFLVQLGLFLLSYILCFAVLYHLNFKLKWDWGLEHVKQFGSKVRAEKN